MPAVALTSIAVGAPDGVPSVSVVALLAILLVAPPLRLLVASAFFAVEGRVMGTSLSEWTVPLDLRLLVLAPPLSCSGVLRLPSVL